MNDFFTYVAVFVVFIILMPFYRVVRGPTLFDRLLAIGAIAGKTIVLILIVGVIFDRLDMFIDLALGYTALNFIGGIAMAEYFRFNRSRQ